MIFNIDATNNYMKMKNGKHSWLYLLLLTLLILSKTVIGQTSFKDLSSVNIEQLSDAQVKDFIVKAQLSGKDGSELIDAAKSRGMSADQIKQLQTRITNLTTTNTTTADDSGQGTRNVIVPLNNIAPANRAIDSLPKIFGADLFNGASTTFEPNLRLATPLNYILGPEDQLNINVYGNSLVNWKLNVSPEGNINIPGVGVVNVNGKTIEQATAAIKTKLAANNYAIGRGTSVQVTLGDIRSIKVIINGEVVRPGTYTLPSLATVFNALYASGGPNTNGSFRQVEVIRNNRIIKKLDVYDFLLKGNQSNNIALRDQDIIRVPTYRVRVEMAGEVKRPALYEVIPGESLQDVINFSGSFSDLAYSARIKVLQITDQQRSITDVYEADFKNYTPLRGDKYIVDRILEAFKNRVSISGAVIRPGDYELEKGLTLSRLIAKASGLRPDAFTERGIIMRNRADNTKEVLPFNVQSIINKTTPDILLQKEDVVSISSISDLRDKYEVNIVGEVRRPGNFAFAQGLTVEDVILNAGGFTQGASTKRIEVSRRINNTDPTKLNGTIAQVYTVSVDSLLGLNGGVKYQLQPFDVVSVYSLPGYEQLKTVKIEGEVMYPGYYSVQKKNERISDLIARAGGLTPSAFTEGGTLKRDNNSILGFDKNKVDTASLQRERIERARNAAKALTTPEATSIEPLRNDYVGIDLNNILKKPGTKADLILEDGDVLRIPKELQTVRVNGEVLYPSSVVYTSGKSFKQYVLNAGGYSNNAIKRKSYIVYPNGTVKGTGKFMFFNNYPDVKPGSEIYIPKKSESRRGLSTQEVVGVTSGLATLGAIIIGILNLSK